MIADRSQAISWAVKVDPTLAPMISGTVWVIVISPEEAKPTISTVVMVEEFGSAVTPAPASRPRTRFAVSAPSTD